MMLAERFLVRTVATVGTALMLAVGTVPYSSGPAFAESPRWDANRDHGDRGGDHYKGRRDHADRVHDRRDDRRDDRREYRDRRHDGHDRWERDRWEREHRGYDHHKHRHWKRGERISRSVRYRVITHYHDYGWRRPPRGHVYVDIDGDVYLMAVATHLIVDILTDRRY